MIFSLFKVVLLSTGICLNSFPKGTNTSINNNERASIGRREVFSESTIYKDKDYWFHLKLNEGVNYIDDSVLIHSIVFGYNGNIEFVNNEVVDGGILIQGQVASGGYRLTQVGVGGNDIWEYLTGADIGYAEYRYFKFTPSSDYTIYSDLYDIFDISVIEYDSFTFYQNINYNAPYNSNTQNMFVNEGAFVDNQPSFLHKLYSLPFFISNGQYFDTIGLLLINGYGTRYKDYNNSGHYPTNSTSGFGYVLNMYYKNSITGYMEIWGFRTFGQYTDTNGDLQTYLDRGMGIVNTEYLKIKFVGGVPTTNQQNYLSQFNNSGMFNGYDSMNIDLAGTFSLIGTTIVGLTSFFNIGFLPGITLGMLILLPFAITIILFVIHLFKR